MLPSRYANTPAPAKPPKRAARVLSVSVELPLRVRRSSASLGTRTVSCDDRIFRGWLAFGRHQPRERVRSVVLRDVVCIELRGLDARVAHVGLYVAQWPDLRAQGAEGVPEVVEAQRRL